MVPIRLSLSWRLWAEAGTLTRLYPSGRTLGIPPTAGGCTQVAGSLLESTSGSNCAKCQVLCFRHLETCVQPPAVGGSLRSGLQERLRIHESPQRQLGDR